MSGFRRRLMMLPSEEDVYVLNNAVLLSDGTVLLADDGTPVAAFVDTDAEPSEWIQGSPTSYEYTFSLDGVPSGKYTWAVGIVDTTKVNGDGIPSVGIQIAVDRTLVTPDGWARIAPVKVR